MRRNMTPGYLLGMLVFLSLAVATYGQQAIPKNFSVSYDKFKNETVVTRKDSIIAGKASAIIFRPILVFPGEKLTQDSESRFTLVFISRSIMCDPFCFKRSHGLIFLADRQRIDLGSGHWEFGSNWESMTYVISRDDLQKLADANSVEFQLGNFEANFASNDKQAVKTILELGTVKKAN